MATRAIKNVYTGNHHIEAAKLLAHLEGYRQTPYWDTNNYRIGFGSDHYTIQRGKHTTLPNVKGSFSPNVRINLQQALWNLEWQIIRFERGRILPYLGSNPAEQLTNWNKISVRARAAIISLVYQFGNINAKSIRGSRLIDAVKQGANNDTIAELFVGYPIGYIDRNRRQYEARYLKGSDRLQRDVSSEYPNLDFSTFSALDQQVLVDSPVPVTAPEISGQRVDADAQQLPQIASLKSFHPKIQYELTRRRLARETVDTHMPFIKLTSLLKIKESDLIDGSESENIIGFCPSLGVNESAETQFADTYSSSGRRSVVGYGTVVDRGTPKRIKLLANNTEIEPDNIPNPGIVAFTSERSLAGPAGVRGGLISAKLKIVAYSVGQLDTLLRYFLRNTIDVVLEYGRVSSTQDLKTLKTFKWDRKYEDIKSDLENIVLRKGNTTIENNIRNYVYDNYGNYEFLIGYVSSFDIQLTKENIYEIDLQIKSVQQFEVPVVQSGVKSNCAIPVDKCKATDIIEYFSPTYSWKDNTFQFLLKNVLDEDGALYSNWNKHVVQLKDRENDGEVQKTSGQSTTAGSSASSYLVSWKFFVEVILNDEKYGILSVFPPSTRDTVRNTIISPTTLTFNKLPKNSDDKLIPNKVGYHPHLRSINPRVMIIYNAYKQNLPGVRRNWENTLSILTRAEIPLTITDIEESIVEASSYGVGTFSSALAENAPENIPGSTLLTSGIWLNTDAIISALTSNDYLSKGLEKLLTDMNAASNSYWNLQLISSEGSNYPGMHVIDAGLSTYDNQQTRTTPLDTVITDITDQQTNREEILKVEFGNEDNPNYIYEFNSKSRVLTNDDLGSECLSINIKYDLPLATSVQAIAGVGGTAQKGILSVINKPELDRLKIFSIANNTETCGGTTQDIESICFRDPVVQAAWYAEQRRKREEAENKKKTTDSSIPEGVDENTILAVRNYGDFGSSLSIVEINPAEMLAYLNLDSVSQRTPNNEIVPAAQIHNFNSSNLTKLLIDITIPGISGINLWQSFLVGKTPSLVKNGYFVVTKIINQITPDAGWTTKIQGMLRYVPPTE